RSVECRTNVAIQLSRLMCKTPYTCFDGYISCFLRYFTAFCVLLLSFSRYQTNRLQSEHRSSRFWLSSQFTPILVQQYSCASKTHKSAVSAFSFCETQRLGKPKPLPTLVTCRL